MLFEYRWTTLVRWCGKGRESETSNLTRRGMCPIYPPQLTHSPNPLTHFDPLSMADNEDARSQVTKGLASDKGTTIKQLVSSNKSAKDFRSPEAKAEREEA